MVQVRNNEASLNTYIGQYILLWCVLTWESTFMTILSHFCFIFEPTCASSTVGSYALLSVCLSVLGAPDPHSLWSICLSILVIPGNLSVGSRAGTSPTVWTRGLACLGLAGTRGLASPIVGSQASPLKLDSDSRVQVGPTSPWTRESKLTALVGSVSTSSCIF